VQYLVDTVVFFSRVYMVKTQGADALVIPAELALSSTMLNRPLFFAIPVSLRVMVRAFAVSVFI
jgi:hypothetical protein